MKENEENLHNDIKLLQNEIKENNRCIDKLEIELSSAKTQNEHSHTNLLDLQTQITNLNLEIRSANESLNSAKMQLSSSDNSNDKNLETIQKLSSEVDNLKSKLKTSENKNEVLKSKVDYMTANLDSDKLDYVN
mmetsp:Transcript_98085/g.211529  ORF Transcript_98085/g.211529 Transcript_98085/m.211529 type:complete len:134 (-) Transcript_98085:616-1017(-)|eukprot:CAMPEP_0116938874 /NCGR_PEP_ID=MMETSP0467-20121206/32396_1 /TAXON_ID=283647 /ORGANISM="Mesodinium pulex, Strain SPMC105" /LENGTH=133 /DNA_ID=CAMNT_0004621037 /DNA_START=217 /DNA_END=618 /DNA_ORIENTATION=-